MSDFRKCLFAFASVALLVAAVPASAATMACTASTTGIVPVHSEGYTETVGNVVVTCDKGTAETAALTGAVTVNLTMGTNITSKLDADGNTTAFISTDGTTPIPSSKATQSSATLMQFTVPSGTDASHLEIGNLVIDATKYAGTSGSASFIQATVFITSGSNPVPATITGGAANVTVAIAQSGLGAVTIPDADNKAGFVFPIKQCASNNPDLEDADADTGLTADLTLKIPEGYQAAWTAASVGAPGSAGTILITFSNVPSGVKIFLNGKATTAKGTATLQLGATSTGDISKVTKQGAAGKVYLYTPTSGTVTAVYTLDTVDDTASETLSVPVYLQYGAGASAVVAGASPATVKAELGPVVPGANTASKDGPLPTRFTTTSNAATSFVSFSKCTCSILFPFVSSLAPFDTGLAVSNTSSDPFKTAAQTGDVTFNFYGTNAPDKKVVSGVAGGSQAIFSLSSVATNFTGYVIAQADFQFCHGFAMIMPVGAVGNVASSGYLGIVLQDKRTSVESAGN